MADGGSVGDGHGGRLAKRKCPGAGAHRGGTGAQFKKILMGSKKWAAHHSGIFQACGMWHRSLTTNPLKN
jgi:hypothetical protein